MTISNTEGGAYLEAFGDLYGAGSPVSTAEADQLWGFASRQYANGASGDVTAILNDPKPNRIYLSIEKDILSNNPNVRLKETDILKWYTPAGNFH